MELSHMLELIAKRGRALVDVEWIVILLVDEGESRWRPLRARSTAAGSGPASIARRPPSRR